MNMYLEKVLGVFCISKQTKEQGINDAVNQIFFSNDISAKRFVEAAIVRVVPPGQSNPSDIHSTRVSQAKQKSSCCKHLSHSGGEEALHYTILNVKEQRILLSDITESYILLKSLQPTVLS